jgi:hypothetical protein
VLLSNDHGHDYHGFVVHSDERTVTLADALTEWTQPGSSRRPGILGKACP